jgi:hypothetical protein
VRRIAYYAYLSRTRRIGRQEWLRCAQHVPQEAIDGIIARRPFVKSEVLTERGSYHHRLNRLDGSKGELLKNGTLTVVKDPVVHLIKLQLSG